jgi:hypothetical protein
MPMPFTQLMQETWDEAVADMDERQRQLADSWRIAIDAAHDGLDAMGDIYPRRHRQLTADDLLPRAGEACHAFEAAWLDLIGLAETVVGCCFEDALSGFDTRDAD